MFMQAGFAFLEAGLTRMKNAGHIAGKNVLIFAIASLVYWAVGFGLAFGDGNGLIGTHGFFPSVDSLTSVGQKPFDWFSEVPGAAACLFAVDFGGFGYFAYVAVTTNLAAAAGAVGGVATAWVVLKKPDISMMLNGVLAALVAITAASGFVAPWAAVVIGLVSGGIAVVGVIAVERIGIDDPIGAVSVHGMAGVWGTLATGLFAVPVLSKNLATGTSGLVYSGSFHQLGVQAIGLLAVGGFTFTASFAGLWVMKKLWGIRVEDEVETAGLDVSEHGMWGYPEFYIPVPGGYGTEAHAHLGTHAAKPAHAGVHQAIAEPSG